MASSANDVNQRKCALITGITGQVINYDVVNFNIDIDTDTIVSRMVHTWPNFSWRRATKYMELSEELVHLTRHEFNIYTLTQILIEKGK